MRSYRVHELRQSLLSNRPQPEEDLEDNVDIERLHRKINASLQQNRKKEVEKISIPLVCPMMFEPHSNFIIGWQGLTIFLIYIYFIQIPIIVAFENQRVGPSHERFFQLVNIPAIMVLMGGMLVKINTGYYKEGVIISDPLLVRRHYFRKYLALDLISILAIITYQLLQVLKAFDNQSMKVFVMLFYLKIFELMEIEHMIVGSFDLNHRAKAAIKLMLMLLKIVLVCNIVACSGYFISDYQLTHHPVMYPDGKPCLSQCYWIMNVTWAGVPLKLVDDFSIQYIYSLYWSSTTMISIGYGDIVPRNPAEIGFTVFMQFLSCLLYAYSINTLWSIIKELNSRKKHMRHRITTINLYMRDKGVGEATKGRVNAYLTNYYKAKNLRAKDLEAEIISELTPALRRQLHMESYQPLFMHPIFSTLDPTLIIDASQTVKEVTYYQHQQAITPDESDPALLFVKRGALSPTVGSTTNLRKVQVGDLIGVYEFFATSPFRMSLCATSYSQCYKLEYSDWRCVLKEYEQILERFYQTRDEVLFYNKLSLISVCCYFCCSTLHPSELCPDSLLREKIGMPSIRKREGSYMGRQHYFRRQFKVHLMEKVQRLRKASIGMKGSEFQHQKSGKKGSLTSHLIPERRLRQMDSPLVPKYRRGGKMFIYNKRDKADNQKALQMVRREHGEVQWPQQEEEGELQIKSQGCDMDELMNYSLYYPMYNPQQLNSHRRRHLFVSSYGFT